MSAELALDVLAAQRPVMYREVEYRRIQAVRVVLAKTGERMTMLELVDRNNNCVVCAPVAECEMVI